VGETTRCRLDEQAESQLEQEIAVDLARQIGRGVRSAEETLVKRYGPGLLYLLKRRTADHELALDVRQDALRVVIEKLRAGGIEQPERLAAYLRGVGLNLLVAHRRKDVRRATTVDTEALETIADERAGPFDRLSNDQIKTTVRQLLEELPTQRDRDILTRVYLLEQDKEAICKALDVDSLHFNRVLFRAKQRFRELLERADGQGRLRLVR
jgi:RNA polymerase sigma factor (sigma-70 family)